MKKAIGDRPEMVQFDENGKPKFKYCICRCPVPICKCIRVAPIDDPVQEYSYECKICRTKGTYVG